MSNREKSTDGDGARPPAVTQWVVCPECNFDDVEVSIVDGRRIEFNCRVCDAFSAQSLRGDPRV